MGLKRKIKVLLGKLGETPRRYLLGAFLRLVYFGLITPYALVWRWISRQGLKRTRGKWTPIAESTDTPNLFNRTV